MPQLGTWALGATCQGWGLCTGFDRGQSSCTAVGAMQVGPNPAHDPSASTWFQREGEVATLITVVSRSLAVHSGTTSPLSCHLASAPMQLFLAYNAQPSFLHLVFGEKVQVIFKKQW